MEKLKNAKWKILALLLVSGLGLLAAYFEPAIPRGKSCLDVILGSPKFMVFFVVVFMVCFATALHKKTNTKFFIWLLVCGFFIGLITQMIGTANNLWAYNESFVFGGFSWSLAAATMLGLSFLIKNIFREIDSKAYNILGLIILVLIIIIFLNEFRTTVRLNFWIYYFALFVFAVVITGHLRLATFLSLILAAWIAGFFSEYMGASIGLWQFFPVTAQSEAAESFTCRLPPLYLVLGCWPLEFLTQVGLSAFISQQNILEDH